jgi:hypothetical protein
MRSLGNFSSGLNVIGHHGVRKVLSGGKFEQHICHFLHTLFCVSTQSRLT